MNEEEFEAVGKLEGEDRIGKYDALLSKLVVSLLWAASE